MASLRNYIITRLLLVIPMILIVLTVIFIVLRILPGDPVITVLGPKSTPEERERLREQLGLNKPIYIQYIEYLANIVRGDLGRSLIFGRRQVIDEIMDRFPATVELAITSLIFGSALGILVGSITVRSKRKSIDVLSRLYGIISYSFFIPWLGLMLQMGLSIGLGLFPVSGRIDPLLTPPRITGLYLIDSLISGRLDSFLNSLWHLTLPTVTLGIVISGIFAKLGRTSFSEVIVQDHVLAARARGVRESTIFRNHVAKNSIVPIMTMMGLQFALLLGGTVLTEATFSWPGMGYLLFERILYRDYNVIQGVLIIFGLLIALINLLVDLLYAYIDPRVRF
ncbi:MAG: ABC transporter permease [Candidatus Caldarchaeales archaeon]